MALSSQLSLLRDTVSQAQGDHTVLTMRRSSSAHKLVVILHLCEQQIGQLQDGCCTKLACQIQRSCPLRCVAASSLND